MSTSVPNADSSSMKVTNEPTMTSQSGLQPRDINNSPSKVSKN